MAPDRILNIDLPNSAERLRDPESFFRSVGKGMVLLDEVHQLPDPGRVLKIAADAFPGIRGPATGSSTLAVARKFRDSLTACKPGKSFPRAPRSGRRTLISGH